MMEYVECKNGDNVLRGTFHKSDSKNKSPLVIMFHGFTGTRSEHQFMFVELSRRLEAEGIASLRFDFMGSGESDGRFEDMSLQSELNDAAVILDYAQKLPYIDTERVFIMGMSMGGVVAGITASRNKENVKALILWAPAAVMSDNSKSGDLLGVHFDPQDIPDIIDMRGLRLGKEFIINAALLNIYGETEDFDKPTLILHGDADKTVPLEYSKRYNSVLKNSKLVVVNGAGHLFDTIEIRARFMAETVSFIKDNIK